MSIDVSKRVWDNCRQKATHKLAMLALADHANGDGYCYPGIERIHTWCNVSDRQMRRIVAELAADGEIYVKVCGGRKGTNEYLVALGMTAAEIERVLVRTFKMDKSTAANTAADMLAKQKRAASERESADILDKENRVAAYRTKNLVTDDNVMDDKVNDDTLTPAPSPYDTCDRNPDIQRGNPDADDNRTIINHQLTIKEPSVDSFSETAKNAVHECLRELFTLPGDFDWNRVDRVYEDAPNARLLISVAYQCRALQSNSIFDVLTFAQMAKFQYARQNARGV